jgi:hypothetical protein
MCDYYIIYWFGVDITENKILLVHIGGMCDQLLTSVHCDVTVGPIKSDIHDIVTVSLKL